MKYLYTFILLFFLIPVSVFANSQIDIESSAKDIVMGQDFTITITLTDLEVDADQAQISIPGIENFNIFSQSNATSFQNINGQTQNIRQFTLGLTPKQIWEFALGPVEIIWDTVLRDNEKLNIQVWTDSIFAPNQNNSLQNDIQEEESTNQWDSLVREVDESIRPIREVKFPLWGHIAIIIFFIWSFYLLLSYVFQKEAWTQKQSISNSSSDEDKNKKYKQYFQSLAWEIWSLKSEDFFHQYNQWLRIILADYSGTDTKTATLSELSKKASLSKLEEFQIFQKSYAYEYSWVDTTSQLQQQYIDDILWLLDR